MAGRRRPLAGLPATLSVMAKITPEDLRRIAGHEIEHIADMEVEIDNTAAWRFTSPVLLSAGQLPTARVAVALYANEFAWLRGNCDFGSTRLTAATWMICRGPLDDGALYVVEDGLLTSQEMRSAQQRWKAALQKIAGR